ncbi:MAG: PspC domain-containing protein [Paludibacteraceae bacterium]|nr:PspC domain-containing protein [Candidatus Physcocola equi]MCQ2234247.1 PspC domain-containing protein [Paludibacteraceae bacterium]
MSKELKLSSNKKFAGVIAGLCEYLDIDVTLGRLIFVLLTLFSVGVGGILAYFIAWLVMKK